MYTTINMHYANGVLLFSCSKKELVEIVLKETVDCNLYSKFGNVEFTSVGDTVYAYRGDSDVDVDLYPYTLGRCIDNIEAGKYYKKEVVESLSSMDLVERKNFMQTLIAEYGYDGLEFLENGGDYKDLFTEAFVKACKQWADKDTIQVSIPSAREIFSIFEKIKKRRA